MASRAPSTEAVPLRNKLGYAIQLTRDQVAQSGHVRDFTHLWAELNEYERLLSEHAGVRLADSRGLEIGYGARPYRLLALISMGVDAIGVDMEVPLLRWSAAEMAAIFRANGIERLAKSLVRRGLFDGPQRKAFVTALRERGYELNAPPERFLVGDAADLELSPESLDFVFSEDVFEHIARPSLEALVPKLARWLRPGGIALIRPNIWTGISGGHSFEWTPHAVTHGWRGRRTRPWEHLRVRRWTANTQLNEMTRADYRALFAEHFEILEERVKHPDLGREFLGAAERDELGAYPPEELFSNQVLFVLRSRIRS